MTTRHCFARRWIRSGECSGTRPRVRPRRWHWLRPDALRRGECQDGASTILTANRGRSSASGSRPTLFFDDKALRRATEQGRQCSLSVALLLHQIWNRSLLIRQRRTLARKIKRRRGARTALRLDQLQHALGVGNVLLGDLQSITQRQHLQKR